MRPWHVRDKAILTFGNATVLVGRFECYEQLEVPEFGTSGAHQDAMHGTGRCTRWLTLSLRRNSGRCSSRRASSSHRSKNGEGGLSSVRPQPFLFPAFFGKGRLQASPHPIFSTLLRLRIYTPLEHKSPRTFFLLTAREKAEQ